MTEMTELKPCPFCGVMPHIYWEAWTDISPDAGVWKLEANHKDSCYITHINGTNISGRSSARRLSQLVEWWNHREELFGNSEQLPSAQPEPRWIPCDKDEPDEDMECWVTVKTTDTLYRGNFTKRYGERRDKGFITSGGFMWWNTALAWMPIYEPEPYSSEGDNHEG